MTDQKSYPLLETINSPKDLRELPRQKLQELADELRDFMIHSVANTGGHLAAGLGTVELSVALHYVFNTPEDRLVWDVGHQSYPHKILTGRRKKMQTLRQREGLAGFPKRDESKYDTFGVGHSSTSISAALGMAIAAEQNQTNRKVVAVIGDGAMTAGMAFEALNHAGDLNKNMLVILNDNEMSISRNVGGMSKYLTKILTGKFYATVKEGGKKVLGSMPTVLELARRTEEHVKGMVVPGTLFEELGFNYVGPIDGHDLSALVTTLTNVSQLSGPQFLHIVTRKGKGYPPAEEDPCVFHGISEFEAKTGSVKKPVSKEPSYTEVFSEWLCDMAEQDHRLVGITPAMREGSGLVKFSEQFPDRYFDTGIAEQHAVTLAAGLACDELKPVVAIYSTFLQRAYDQLIHDVALQNLPVMFAIDRAGLVGPDGPTHAGSFDLSYLRCIPNMMIMAPSDENECRKMLTTGFQHNGPSAIRYPRGKGPGTPVTRDLEPVPVGRGEIRLQGKNIVILAFGSMLAPAMKAAETLQATVANMRFVKPLDEQLIMDLACQHKLLVTVEENAIAGGAGSAVSELLTTHQINTPILHLGLPDKFIEHGDREELFQLNGLDSEGIYKTISLYYKQSYQQDCKPERTQLIS